MRYIMSRLRPTDSDLHWQRDCHRALLLRQWAARDGVSDDSDSEDDGGVHARGDPDNHGGALLNELSRDAAWVSAASGGCRADRGQAEGSHSRPSSAVDRASFRRTAEPHGDASFRTEATSPAGRRGGAGYPTPLTQWDRGMPGERAIQRPASTSRPLFGPERHSAGVAAAAFLSSAAGAPPAGAKPTHHVPVPSSYVRKLIQAVRTTQPIPAVSTKHHPHCRRWVCPRQAHACALK